MTRRGFKIEWRQFAASCAWGAWLGSFAIGAAPTSAQAEDRVDLSKPLFIAPGHAMCASSSDVKAELAGTPSDCSQASRALPVATMSVIVDGGIVQVRLLGSAQGTVFWVPYGSLTNAAPAQ